MGAWSCATTRRGGESTSDLLHLNIGCGPWVLPGYVNLDLQTYSEWASAPPGATMLCDVRQGLPFPDGTAASILAEQFLEHLSLPEMPPFLDECRRVLCPGGRLQLTFPDVAAIAEIAARGEQDFVSEGEGCIVPGVPPGLCVLNHVATGWGHKSILTLGTVRPMVRKRFEVLWACVNGTNALVIARR